VAEASWSEFDLGRNLWTVPALLRFLTRGSVDDGKSTLIGRLLLEAQVVPEDQLAALQRDSRVCDATGEELARAAAEGGPPPLGLHILMGTDAPMKTANMLRNLEHGQIAPVEISSAK
jgi:hypothetical protein